MLIGSGCTEFQRLYRLSFGQKLTEELTDMQAYVGIPNACPRHLDLKISANIFFTYF